MQGRYSMPALLFLLLALPVPASFASSSASEALLVLLRRCMVVRMKLPSAVFSWSPSSTSTYTFAH